ncbi:MAG: lipase maturation factor family protein [Verrucomicrobiota bacterium]
MPEINRVQSPPARPLLVFDGDCQFCRRWVARWKSATGEAVDYLPFQDAAVPARFPEIPPADFEEAIHLILPDGSVSRGAEAVFRSLAEGGRHRWLWRLYQKFPPFAEVSETLYEEVALHRTFFSRLDQVYSGPGTEPPGGVRVRWLFLRGLALIYLIAFVSLGAQMQGLIGSHGIAPARELMSAVNLAAAQNHLGLDRFHLVPTFAWWSASDRALNWQCALGVAGSLALLAGVAPALMLALLWALYLSFCTIASPFFNFQWDSLLLETGFLAIFYAPLQWLERPSRQAPPPALVVWLLRWELFRLMFESGCVKLMSGDPSWWNLTALRVHYETQPLPTWIGWHAHQLPAGAQAVSQFLMLAIELAAPALIFCGRRPRLLAAGAFAALQVAILLTGNYTFFNWLAILLCVPLLDDRVLKMFRRKSGEAPAPATVRPARWPWAVTLGLSVVVVTVTLIQVLAAARSNQRWPAPVLALYGWLEPFRSLNSYGLFAVMTQTRPEIVIEGSDDGRNWQAYEFKHKPGDLKRRPGFVAPYQPRLDWQMWFAALGSPRGNPWFLSLELRLLQNAPPVLALLGRNPFPAAPPKYIRAQLYEYHFTDIPTRRATGQWWRRELKRAYVPPLSLEDFRAGQEPGRQ